ncbi:hypothetical protein SPACI_016230 [Sporomusa acidovorans DSM 3132]|uniref:Uncharacterized protein n=1 Tax=Sporomusa acidovorans (strain ATCC 49682 / DSM 3132 / Mol) TaxID=1123286 RepID=A0ABZ3IZR6_SPOA4|nr:hypothetical protein SPACI_56830 [Sporomusa acidovorans DSM 3132]SDF53344.1 hypothetical protein SAMN04488499_105617 [Sporomusa acidovorans]
MVVYHKNNTSTRSLKHLSLAERGEVHRRPKMQSVRKNKRILGESIEQPARECNNRQSFGLIPTGFNNKPVFLVFHIKIICQQSYFPVIFASTSCIISTPP